MSQQKVIVFISHAKDDETLALILKEFLENIFLNTDFFVSGSDLGGGEVWIEELRDKLETATAIIALITPYSIDNKWVYFESGAGFTRRRSIPVVADGIDFGALPAPLSLLQGRTYDMKGLKSLVSDISTLAGLREPSRHPGIEDALARVEEFLLQRKTETAKPVTVTDKVFPQELFILSKADPELQTQLRDLTARAKRMLAAAIQKYKMAYDVPQEDELNSMSINDLYHIAESVGLEPSISLLSLEIMEAGALAKATDSKWQKRNSQSQLQFIERTIVDFEKKNQEI